MNATEGRDTTGEPERDHAAYTLRDRGYSAWEGRSGEGPGVRGHAGRR